MKRGTKLNARRAAWQAGVAAGLLIAGMACGVWAQTETADVQVTLGAGTAAIGETVEIPVDLSSTGDAPTSILVVIQYNDELLEPYESYYEVNAVDGLGLPILNSAGDTDTVSSLVKLKPSLQANGKHAEANVHAGGTISVLVSGAGDVSIPNGRLFDIAFRVRADVTHSFTTALTGVTADTPATVDGDVVFSEAAADMEKILTVGFTNGQVQSLPCIEEPAAPQAFEASTDRPGGVRLTWKTVPGAVGYRVYRSETASPSEAIPLGDAWSSATSFVDITARANTEDAAGCFGGVAGKSYTYWVRARLASGCQSPLSGSAGGRRDAYTKLWNFENASVDVFPGRSAGGPVLLTDTDSQLAIRLQGSGDIQPGTVWGQIVAGEDTFNSVRWVPALEANATALRSSTGWVVFTPSRSWVAGETITMTVGARTTGNDEVTAVTRQFMLAPDSAGSSGAGSTPSLLALGLDEVPKLAEGYGTPYSLGPVEIYTDLKEIWLPVPGNRNPGDVDIYYYDTSEADGRWILGRNVRNWLGPRVDTKQVGGVTYVGYWVRHGGVVQLGAHPGGNPAAAAIAPVPSGRAGTLLLMAFTVLALVLSARRTARVK